MANIQIPAEHPCVILIAESSTDKISLKDPLSLEKMSELLTMYRANDWEEALEVAKKVRPHGRARSYLVVPHLRVIC